AEALERGARHGLVCRHMSSRTHPDDAVLDREITSAFREHGVDLVVLAGYMKRIGPQLLAAYPDRIINIHPSLLPRHGGQGMYGKHVHEAVIAAGEQETGVTIHLVNNEYDRGRILAQRRVRVEPGDDAESLARRVLEVEHRFYVEVLDEIIRQRIVLDDPG
ncbi:MAG: phosphoribosylglycinamide formyltransferase, partial [Gammaproteobacteria bacterium]|nr:phosphoribosylglycinamide formyltransferase [Gammaproteobacteria bacterium]